MSKPLAIDLYAGLGGWADGFLAEGYDVVGFDIERHDYGTGGYPGQLVLQDVLTLDGRQFRNAAVIVASPPCQEYSYMAMPWSRAKEKAAYIRARQTEWAQLTALFWACFRIAREAGVPLVVENVKGAQSWVGRAKANYGSFFLWGDIDSVGGAIVAPRPKFGETLRAKRGGKNDGGSWFAIGSPGQSNVGQNPDGRKMPGLNWSGSDKPGYVARAFHEHEKTGQPGRSFQSAAVDGLKVPSMTSWDGYGKPGYKPQGFNVTAAQRYREEQGTKQEGSGAAWFDNGICKSSSRSDYRKAASAQIAKIPLPLAGHIARIFKSPV